MHLVVVRRDIAVVDGPVFAVLVAGFRLEVVVGEAQSEAAPNVGLAAEAARTHPRVIRSGIRILPLVYDDVFVVIAVTDVAVELLVLFESRSERRPANCVFRREQRVRAWRQPAA